MTIRFWRARDAGPPSPCIKVCVLDRARATCTGCWRTVEEIAGWSQASAAERERILARVAARRCATSAGADAANTTDAMDAPGAPEDPDSAR